MTEKINSIRDKICSFLQEGKGHVANIKGLKFNPGCIPTIHVWGNRAERASSVGKFGRPIVSSMYHLLFKKAVTEILTWQEPQKFVLPYPFNGFPAFLPNCKPFTYLAPTARGPSPRNQHLCQKRRGQQAVCYVRIAIG